MASQTTRISISLPTDLVEEFDRAMREKGFPDRSKAVQTCLRQALVEWPTIGRSDGEVTGALVLLYDHETRGCEGALTDLQHSFHDVVKSSMHIHLDPRSCLEIIAVKGKSKRLEGLSRRLLKVRGVRQLKTNIVVVKPE